MSRRTTPNTKLPTLVGLLVIVGLAGILLVPWALALFTDTGPVPANTLAADTLDSATGLTATCGASVTLDWTATTDTYASGHRVLRATTPGGPYTQIAELTPRTTVTYTDSPADGTYYYVARAYVQNWESTDSNEASATASSAGIAFDGASSSTGSSTLTWSHTVAAAGCDRIIVVGISHRENQPITGVTYAGQALTLIGGRSDPNDDSRIELWYRLAPATGTNSVQVTFSVVGNAVAGATSWTGVNQTTPLGAFVSANGISATATVNVSSATGEVVVDTLANKGGGPPTAGTGQTQRWSAEQGNVGGGGSHEPGAATVTMSWTQANKAWAIGAVPLKPA